MIHACETLRCTFHAMRFVIDAASLSLSLSVCRRFADVVALDSLAATASELSRWLCAVRKQSVITVWQLQLLTGRSKMQDRKMADKWTCAYCSYSLRFLPFSGDFLFNPISFLPLLPSSDNECSYKYGCVTTNQQNTKSTLYPNRNATDEQHAVVSIKIIIGLSYVFIRGSVLAPFVLVFVVVCLVPPTGYEWYDIWRS